MADFLIVEVIVETDGVQAPRIVDVVRDRPAKGDPMEILEASDKLEPSKFYRAVRYDDARLFHTVASIEAVDTG